MRRIPVSLHILFFCLSALFSSFTYATTCPSVVAIKDQRYLVVISDLHFGVGRTPDGNWDPTEDFRWTRALTGFLNRISQCGNNAVDLVVAGDALELWQPPQSDNKCDGPSQDASCTPEQFLALTKIVIKAHQEDFAAFGKFADNGSNRVYFVPGNHDAAILLDDPWAEVTKAIGSKSKRVFRVDTGYWVSSDGKVVVEHGHQIGEDVNRYASWPDIIRKANGKEYVESPWGERFVQVLFNEQEVSYPIIDNLSPETAGARYRMADRGLWNSIDDVARFIRFNLFETSLAQKVTALGGNEDPNKPPKWDIKFAREKKHELFSHALAANDPFLLALQSSDDKAVQLRAKLDFLANDSTNLPDDEVMLLCNQIAIRSHGTELCKKPVLGYLRESLLTARQSILTTHIKNLIGQPGLDEMKLFIYGHTHQFKDEVKSVQVTSSRSVKVFNTGAFQRLVDEHSFLARASAKKLTAIEALKSLTVEDLAPCYSAVVVGIGPYLPSANTVYWLMTEDNGQSGSFTLPENEECK